jgi:hypothetical protein
VTDDFQACVFNRLLGLSLFGKLEMRMKARLGFAGIGALGIVGLAVNVSLLVSSNRYMPRVLVLAVPSIWGGFFFALFPKPPGRVGAPPAWWFVGGPVACALLFLAAMIFVVLNA